MKEKFLKYFKGDTAIWVIIFILAIVSMLVVWSATGTLAYKKMAGTWHFLFKHGGFLLFGLAVIYVVHNVSYKFFFTFSQLLLYISVPLLIFTLFRGVSLNSASRWITLPGTGISFQTSDLAKFALFMYVSRILAANQDNISDPKAALRPILIWVGVICALILPANFSTSAMIFAVCMILMYIGRIPMKYLMGIVGAGLVAIVIFLVLIWNMPDIGRFGTWKNRIENFIGGDNQDADFQSNQAKIAIVNGGVFGMGPGNSIQRNYLPHPYSDFVYATIIEEYGLIGGIVILMLYLFILFRVGIIVRKCERTFPAFLIIGLAFSLVFQALINMAVAVNLFPVTGQTLPFVSMGGTSIIFTSVALGIILNVSRQLDNDSEPEMVIDPLPVESENPLTSMNDGQHKEK